jgi:hypothetical protein
MAISVSVRPRKLAYLNSGSPPIPVYTYWNAGWNPIVYEFNIPSDDDRLSSLMINVYELGSNTLLASNIYKPFVSGNFIFDVSPFIRAYLYSKYTPDLSKLNSIDQGNALRFYITYTQTTQNGTVTFNSEQPYPITASCSAMQFGDQDNGSMNRFTPLNLPIEEDLKAKFLTAFERPMMFKGYPLTLSFIYDASLGGFEVFANIEEQNINGAQLLLTDNILDSSSVKKINYLKIAEPTQSNTKKINAYLHTGDTINDYYVDNGYVDNGYVQII